VNRDSTFLALLGTALAKEPPATILATCCSPLADPRVMLADSPVLRYSGSITLCALAAKLDDDACDERGWRCVAAHIGRRALDEPIAAALGHLHALNFPVKEVRDAMADQSRAESPFATLEESAAPTRAAFGEIAAHLAEVAHALDARAALRELGANLGFLVYAHDAWHDWERDRARGLFNPLRPHLSIEERRAAVVPAMRTALERMTGAFQDLPLRRNAGLLHFVLVEGAGRCLAEISGDEPPPRRGESRAKRDAQPRGQRKRRCCDKRDCCDCSNCCDCGDCFRCLRPGSCGRKSGNSACDCNPCDGDGCECCGCDCSP
jgi:hypothetical protein